MLGVKDRSHSLRIRSASVSLEEKGIKCDGCEEGIICKHRKKALKSFAVLCLARESKSIEWSAMSREKPLLSAWGLHLPLIALATLFALFLHVNFALPFQPEIENVVIYIQVVGI